MDKTIPTVIGAVAAIALCSSAPADAQPGTAPQASIQSYADLLAPIENPVALLRADDLAKEAQLAKEGGLQQVQYHHHHHHHHRYRRRRRHHHHHHHHHHNHHHHDY